MKPPFLTWLANNNNLYATKTAGEWLVPAVKGPTNNVSIFAAVLQRHECYVQSFELLATDFNFPCPWFNVLKWNIWPENLNGQQNQCIHKYFKHWTERKAETAVIKEKFSFSLAYHAMPIWGFFQEIKIVRDTFMTQSVTEAEVLELSFKPLSKAFCEG